MVKNSIQKAGRFIWNNKWCFMQMGIMLSVHNVCGATVGGDVSTGMPWDTGINAMQDALTGPIPKAGSVIAISTGAGMWMLGQGQVSQTAIRATLGSGIALGSPAMVSALAGSGTGSGCIF